jgi:hypothetical protein
MQAELVPGSKIQASSDTMELVKGQKIKHFLSPGSEIRCFLTPESEIREGKKCESGSGRNIPDLFSASLNTLMQTRIRDLFDPGSGMEKFRSGINIPDPQHWLNITTQN